jgi:hypothetical protein
VVHPAPAVEAKHVVHVGGPKYSEFEIEPAPAISPLVYGGEGAPLESNGRPGEYPSGQRTHAVNVPAHAFAGSNPASPIAVTTRHPVKPTRYERKLGQRCEAVINQKRRVTIPQKPFFQAGLENGSRIRVTAISAGRVLLEQVSLPEGAAGYRAD